ncbi:hypothetical protein FRB94_000677 [Tulasnella sp. JGI-2019a]|nr:hypothetical protein FRB94_000677 [Tulasnella sp. JGI-2019a]
MASPERPTRNRYSGAISALIQTGAIHSVARVLTIIASFKSNIIMTPIVGRISVEFTGISATLLVLQLEIYQKRTRERDGPLTTGPTFAFAHQEMASSMEGGERSQAPGTRQRISTSMATHQPRDFIDIENTQISPPRHVTAATTLPEV